MTVVMDSNLDVDKALKFAKGEADKSKQKRTYNAKPTKPNKRLRVSRENPDLAHSSNASNLAHGTMVNDEYGVGIVIDRDYNLRRMAEQDTELQLMMAVGDPSDATFENIQFKNERVPGEESPIEEHIRKNPFSEEALKLKEVKDAFKDWDICAMDENTGAVLAPAGSPQCIAYKEAMAAVRSGKVRLPTIAEYEEQKRRAAKTAKEKIQNNKIVGNKSSNNQQPKPETQSNQRVQEKLAPEKKATDKAEIIDLMESRLKLNEEAQKMTVSEKKAVVSQAAPDPALTAINTPVVAPKSVSVSDGNTQQMSQAVPTTQKAIPVDNAQPDPMLAAIANAPAAKSDSTNGGNTKKQPAVLDLGAAEVDAAIKAAEDVKSEVVEEETKPDVVIEVPIEKADTFMKTVPKETKEKISVAKKIKVNFVGDVTLPNTVNRISNLSQYRRVAPKNVGNGLTQAALINSGYIGYFRPVGSLEWSMISPIQDEEGGVKYPDVGKIAQFCYNHLAYTSIGPLSYVEFTEQTAYEDLDHILYTLMRGSQPDKQTVAFVCQRETCQREYSTTYYISELPDYDKMSPEAREQTMKISDAKDTIDDAKEVHNESPVMRKLVYDAKSTGTIFVLKNFDIATIVDRMPILEEITRQYGEVVAILIQFTNEVYIKVADTGDPDKDYSISTDPAVIAEEYFRIDNEDKDGLADTLDVIPRFDPITYTIKGRVVCSHCGNVLINPRQNIQTLVFHIALMARYHG